MSVGIIGGSGLYSLSGFEVLDKKAIDTPFGSPSDSYILAKSGTLTLAFLARHGSSHSIPPHRLNYRANIWGFKMLGVKAIVAFSAVGAINPSFKVSDIVMPEQLIDFTGGSRVSTFFDNEAIHVDFTHPYCSRLRDAIKQSAKAVSVPLHDTGTYICVNGPRLETAHEIRFFAQIGADIIGMTGMPEAVLAREAEICYANVSVITNLSAGISKHCLTTTEVKTVMSDATERIALLIKGLSETFDASYNCLCHSALSNAKL